jgi:hypothetical protein
LDLSEVREVGRDAATWRKGRPCWRVWCPAAASKATALARRGVR